MILEISILCVAIIFIIASLLPLIPSDYWWIRVFDFPRLQIWMGLALSLIAYLFYYDFQQKWNYLFAAIHSLALIYQTYKIYPYTFLAPFEVKKTDTIDDQNSISIMVSNVLTPNRASQKLIDTVYKNDPDVLLTVESDKWWEKQLEELEKQYPYTVKIPLDNLYGMHLYSKKELLDTTVHYHIKKDIPSIETHVDLDNGTRIKLYCTHPEPPSPTESETSTPRDGELLLIAKKLQHDSTPVLVFGDLNDVAWSKTTTIFQKTSGLLDPRKGRGFFSTFNANYPLLRWPLDHIFHSECFTLNKIKKLNHVGSDHFPIFASFQYTPKAEDEHDAPERTKESKEFTREQIQEAQAKHQ